VEVKPMTIKYKDPEKIYKELLVSYQQEGYTLKQAKKFATEDTEEILIERANVSHKNETFNKGTDE